MMNAKKPRMMQSVNQSLKNLAAEKIVKNIHLYSGDWSSAKPLKNLPVTLSKLLLLMLERMERDSRSKPDRPEVFEKRVAAFMSLLSSETKEIVLDGLMTFCPREELLRQCLKIVQSIGICAPNVQILIFQRKKGDAESPILPAFDSWMLAEAFCQLEYLDRLVFNLFERPFESARRISRMLEGEKTLPIRRIYHLYSMEVEIHDQDAN